MNIQQNLNALLTMGAVAARASDKYAKNTSIRQESKYGKAINKRVVSNAESIDKETFKTDPGVYEDELKLHVEDAEKRLESDKRMAELDPSQENFNEISDSNAYLQNVKEQYEKAKQANIEEAIMKGQTDNIKTVRGQRENSPEEREKTIEQRMSEEFGFEIPGGRING